MQDQCSRVSKEGKTGSTVADKPTGRASSRWVYKSEITSQYEAIVCSSLVESSAIVSNSSGIVVISFADSLWFMDSSCSVRLTLQ